MVQRLEPLILLDGKPLCRKDNTPMVRIGYGWSGTKLYRKYKCQKCGYSSLNYQEPKIT